MDGAGLATAADSMLGRPLDALGATRADVYAFTHAVMYLADPDDSTPRRRVRAPAPGARGAGRGRTGRAGHRPGDERLRCDRQILLAWPLLELEWGAEAVFAFAWLASEQDELGFLPGSTFDPARRGDAGGGRSHAIASSYHATLVMGFLCAALRARGARRRASCRTAPAVAAWRARCWRGRPRRRRRPPGGAGSAGSPMALLAALAPLFLAMALHDARERGDAARSGDALALALPAGLAADPAPRQAAALLRRAGLLEGALQACAPPAGAPVTV